MTEDIYKNYTSTSVLTGMDVRRFTEWSHRYFRHFILPHISEDRTCKILEVGCGYGRYTQLLTQTLGYEHTVGVDISEEQIEYARKNYKLTNVYKSDALEYLKKGNEKYDAVILMDVLEHLELGYAIALLAEIRESLTPTGKLIIQVPNGLSPMTPIFHNDVTHVRPFTVNSISQILRMAGFSHFTSHAVPPMVYNIKSAIHWFLWKSIVHPLVYIFLLMSHGSPAGGIYSSNLLAIAYKS